MKRVAWYIAATGCFFLAVFFGVPAVWTNKLNLGVAAVGWVLFGIIALDHAKDAA